MVSLTYSQTIDASRERVWSTITELGSYKKWAVAFSPNSQFIGTWEQGKTIRFFDPNLGGTIARLSTVSFPEKIVAEHVAIASKNGDIDTESDVAKKWIGVRESYSLATVGGSTLLTVDILTHADFKQMFDDAWPEAFRRLKAVCEQ